MYIVGSNRRVELTEIIKKELKRKKQTLQDKASKLNVV